MIDARIKCTQEAHDIITRRSANNADCTALRVWNVKRASLLLESVPLGPNFTETGSSLPKC